MTDSSRTHAPTAARKGWTVADADDEISGAEFGDRRPRGAREGLGERVMVTENPFEREWTPEQLFAEFKSLVTIHLHQILKLDAKPPIFTVALLVAVACEQLSHLFPSEGSADEVFSKAIIEPHEVSRRVGRDLFDVTRNGFAHSYYPKMLSIGGEEVGVAFSWKRPNVHLRVYGMQRKDGHNAPVPVELDQSGRKWLVIVVDDMRRSLYVYLDDLEKRLKAGTITLDVDAIWPKKPIQGPAAAEWRAFLDSRAVHSEGGR